MKGSQGVGLGVEPGSGCWALKETHPLVRESQPIGTCFHLKTSLIGYFLYNCDQTPDREQLKGGKAYFGKATFPRETGTRDYFR